MRKVGVERTQNLDSLLRLHKSFTAVSFVFMVSPICLISEISFHFGVTLRPFGVLWIQSQDPINIDWLVPHALSHTLFFLFTLNIFVSSYSLNSGK